MKSLAYIKEKIEGQRLTELQIKEIIKDTLDKKIPDIHLSAFISALDSHGLTLDEEYAFSKAMVETGKTLKLGRKLIVDKHSVGGIPGDKTSLLVVPIVASAGLCIPKTSSRAITSPAGTADRMEVLAPVKFNINEIKKIISKTNACLVWGGSLDIAPADDIFIKIEYSLGIDPLMLPSIISKKKAIGSKYIVVDIPTGRGAKIKTVGVAHELAHEFIRLGKKLGMKINCAVTYGEQPLGFAVGPALEAREALLALKFPNQAPPDLVEKSCILSGILFDLLGKGGKFHALNILRSGKAYKKMQEIISAQDGDPKINPYDIRLGKYRKTIKSKKSGMVLWIKNSEIVQIARTAGAPKQKGSGILLSVKSNYLVKKDQPLFTIFSEKSSDLNKAAKIAEELEPVVVAKDLTEKMLLDKIPGAKHKRTFMLER